jgi:crossover junction endodeoxyribonuclease RuvC
MVIIGLDLSLTAPGWYLRTECGQVSFGTWKPPGRDLDRMHWICRKVLELLPAVSDVVVMIEGFSFGSKGNALYEIAGLGYIVRYALRYRQIPFIEVAPPTVKKFATGKGNVNKNIVIREVFKRWGIDAEDDNAADAFVLGQIGLCLHDLAEPTTEFQRAIVAELRKKMPKVAA